MRQMTAFRQSAWFRRGWTLQELLAPPLVRLYNDKWEDLGSKHSEFLVADIVEASGISKEALAGQPLASFSVAQRMSWAAYRQTTRIEDRAYSLMGIFNVNMVPLYGEGSKAFIRLQREILQNCDDHSIFAWHDQRMGLWGLLAPDPSYFKRCGMVTTFQGVPGYAEEVHTLSFGSGAISTSLKMSRLLHSSDMFVALLNCRIRHHRIGILLTYTNAPVTHSFARITISHVPTIPGTGCLDTDKIKVLDHFQPWRIDVLQPEILSTLPTTKLYGFKLSLASSDFSSRSGTIANHFTDSTTDRDCFSTKPGKSGSVLGLLPAPGSSVPTVVLGLDPHMHPACMLLTHPRWQQCAKNDSALSLLGLKSRKKELSAVSPLPQDQSWGRHAQITASSRWPPQLWASDELPPTKSLGAESIGSYVLTREREDEEDTRWYIRAAPMLVAHDFDVTLDDVYPELDVYLPDIGMTLKLTHAFGTPEPMWRVDVLLVAEEASSDAWAVRETSEWLVDAENPQRQYKTLEVVPPTRGSASPKYTPSEKSDAASLVLR